MAGILFLIYLVAGYWAVGQTIFAYKYEPFGVRAFFALALGWILIPIAIIKIRIRR